MLALVRGRTKEKLSEDYEEADAIILEFHPTGLVRDGMFEAHILLQVMPRNERNYVIECNQFFSRDDSQELCSGVKTKIFFCLTEPSKIRWMKHAKDGA